MIDSPTAEWWALSYIIKNVNQAMTEIDYHVLNPPSCPEEEEEWDGDDERMEELGKQLMELSKV